MAEDQKRNEKDEINEALSEEEIEAQDDEIGESVDEAGETVEVGETEEQKLKDQLIRAHAQMENIKRRAERDVQAAHKFASEKLLKELLPIMDSLEHAIDAAGDQKEEMKAMLEGLELTHKMFMDTLQKFGVQPINPVNEPFNPNEHEAMTMAPSEEHKPNTVITVIQKGYILHDRVVRPARVIVSR